MYVYLKMDGQIDDRDSIGVGKFECALKIDVPKEEFEQKLNKKKMFYMDEHKVKIEKLEKIMFSNESFAKETTYILPIGASMKKKNVLQKVKSLYFG